MIIREVSEKTGISIDNLRYYERIGLIPPVPRTESGIRNYDEMSIHWIEFAMRFKKAEVPLEAIHEYIQLGTVLTLPATGSEMNPTAVISYNHAKYFFSRPLLSRIQRLRLPMGWLMPLYM